MRDSISKILILFVAIFTTNVSFGQDEATPTYNLSSPYHAIKTQLENLQEDNYHPNVAAKVFQNGGISSERSKELAIKWLQILDGEGIFIDMDEIPTTTNYKDSITNKSQYVLTSEYPDVFLQRNGNQWLYSPKSFKKIESLHSSIYPLGTDFLINLFPKYAKRKFLGLHLWQYAGILILIAIAFLLHKVLSFFVKGLIIRILEKLGFEKLAQIYIKPVAGPISAFLILLLVIQLAPSLLLPINAAKYLMLILKLAIPVIVTLIFYHMVNVFGAYLEKLAERSENTLDDQLIPLVRKALRFMVVIMGLLFVLRTLGFDITALIAGVSIGGLALAFAAQDTIRNFFGSFMIFLDRPFQIGDVINSNGVEGVIEEVGFRSTRVRTFDNSITSVPNGELANQPVNNFGLRQYRRFKMHIGVTYDTPPDLIELFVEGLREIIANHPDTRKDVYEVHLNSMGDSALLILFHAFFNGNDWVKELKGRHEILMSVIRLAERLNVQFAFPTQTLHMENFPGKPSLSPEYEKDMELLRKEMDTLLKANKS